LSGRRVKNDTHPITREWRMLDDKRSRIVEERVIEKLIALGNSEEQARRFLKSSHINDVIYVQPIKQEVLQEIALDGQERISKRSNWQGWLIIIIALATLSVSFVSLAVALHWL
jgi:hypothetical protein